MCGIVGYVGQQQAAPLLLDGLCRLEYRGYDSAGIAVCSGDTLQVRKTPGRLAALETLTHGGADLPGTVGIGHTRWATHGEPNQVNAHPQVSGDGKFAVVHNGIIENFARLKQELIQKGCTFVSETDTEVVAQLLAWYYSQCGDVFEAVSQMLSQVEGSYALGILCADTPDRIIAARKDAPLLLGCGRGENFLASDVTALLRHTRDVVYMDDGELAVITAEGIRIYDERRRPIDKEHRHIDWDVDAAEKGGYDHFMLKEIYEQPESLRNTITPRIVNSLPDFTEDGIDDEVFKNCENITVIACGTAMHAGIVGKAMIESELRIPVNVEIASEFRYKEPLINEKTLVIVTSQSGETIDTLEAMRLAKRCGSKVISIVNVKGSTIARESDYVLYTHAGPEIAVASTKAYAVQMAAMYLSGCRLGLVKGIYSEDRAKEFIGKLLGTIPVIEETLLQADEVKAVANYIKMAPDAFFIGRGMDYTLSLEGALKLKEISYVHAEAYAAGELKHGTIALITENVPVIALATQPAVYEKMVSNIREVKARGAYVILISMGDEVTDTQICDKHIRIPKQDSLFTVFAAAVILQLIAYYTSDAKGLDVDKPRNLAKSVTVE